MPGPFEASVLSLAFGVCDMALVTETGAGLANADAFITLAFADAYHTAKGNTTWTGTDALKENAIRRATTYLSNSYTWKGLRSHGRSQALMWPRAGIWDQEGYGIPSDQIPIEIQNATAEIALRELVTPGAMNPDFVASDLVKKETIGPMSVEYALASVSADAQRPVLLIVRDMVSQFLEAGAGNSIVGSSFRA